MTPRKKQWRTRWRDRKAGYVLRWLKGRAPALRAAPLVAVFPPEAGAAQDPRSPVRIFVGSEAAQARAERVLVWSILKHRQPGRAYEIHLMKDLAGFSRRTWKTGFSLYRYAIPAFAGGAGRAIYNDADQVYLADPADLFDREMGAAGAIDIDGQDTSVMLIDCARMAPVWPLTEVQAEGRKHKHFRAARDAAGLWGPIDAAWNARDDEFEPGASKLLHFTTLPMQPWRPFPGELRYRPHDQAALWRALEVEADAAGFTIFTGARPSAEFPGAMAALLQAPAATSAVLRGVVGRALERAGGAPLALVASPASIVELETRLQAPGRLAPVSLAADAAPERESAASAVLLPEAGLIPPDDLPWVLDRAFRAARQEVIACPAPGVNPRRWKMELEAAARRNPGKTWRLGG